jgi:endonuclease VIII
VPEGDTIFRAARTLQRALASRVVERFDTHLAPLAVVDQRAPLAGRTIERVDSQGKHLLIHFSGDLTLRTHLRMQGSWHIYKPGERWRGPGRDAHIVIATDEWVAVGFRVSDAEFAATSALARHPRLSTLGPDVLSAVFDVDDARRRIRATPARHIAEALLRQQSLAGLGNVFKSELLFLCGVDPALAVPDVGDDALDCLLRRARELMRLNVAETSIAASSRGRVTTGRLNPREPLWVYGRTGSPCFKCGTTILSAMETDGRRTYWCPRCQER